MSLATAIKDTRIAPHWEIPLINKVCAVIYPTVLTADGTVYISYSMHIYAQAIRKRARSTPVRTTGAPLTYLLTSLASPRTSNWTSQVGWDAEIRPRRRTVHTGDLHWCWADYPPRRPSRASAVRSADGAAGAVQARGVWGRQRAPRPAAVGRFIYGRCKGGGEGGGVGTKKRGPAGR